MRREKSSKRRFELVVPATVEACLETAAERELTTKSALARKAILQYLKENAYSLPEPHYDMAGTGT